MPDKNAKVYFDRSDQSVMSDWKKFWRLFCLNIFVLHSIVLKAQGLEQLKLKVIYINGIGTSKKTAEQTLLRIKSILDDDLKNQYEKVEYENFYNHSYNSYFLGKLGALVDFPEAILQTLILNSHIPLQGLMPFYHRNLRDMNNRLQKYIAEGHQIFIITHSQGGLFANQLYKLNPQKTQCHVANLQMATPSAFLGFSISDYMTNRNDIILRVPYSLPANMPGVKSMPEYNGREGKIMHNVLSIYLSSRFKTYHETFRRKSLDLVWRMQECSGSGLAD